MNFRNILIALLLFIGSSCGIPTDKQEAMNNSLLHHLSESFQNDSLLLPSQVSVELNDIQKNDDDETGVYKASFLFTFNNFWDKSKYEVRGTAYYDDNGSIVIENGKKNICIRVISKNHKLVSSDELALLRPKDTLGW